MGIDNADENKFKIHRNYPVGGNGNVLTINGSNNVGIGTTSPSSKLHIKGAGTTSGTTSLLVEDSNGDDLLKVTDDGTVTINDILTIPGQHPLPSSPSAGTFAVSSSTPPKPYFYDGTSWNSLY